MSDLKPCPFCGAPAELIGPDDGEHEWTAACTGCLVKISDVGRDVVVAAWNRRADDMSKRLRPPPASWW